MGSEADGKTIADYIETLELDDPAGIVCPPMADGTEAYIDRAVSDGVTVATYLSESTNQTDTRICFVGSDAVAGGATAAQMTADYTGALTISWRSLRRILRFWSRWRPMIQPRRPMTRQWT